ncbi:hypothetical protein OSTOST_11650, partial [Ostertagia ostertagi]
MKRFSVEIGVKTLFSFDGLTPGTWFAFRIHYQLYYESSQPQHELKTKQEIIVRTKETQQEDPTKINDSIAYIDDLFLTKDNIYIGVASVFKDTKKVRFSTDFASALACSGSVLVHPCTRHHLKTKLGPATASFVRFNSTRLLTALFERSAETAGTTILYFETSYFPFLRVAIQNRTSETFRGKEWCGSIDEAQQLLSSSEGHMQRVSWLRWFFGGLLMLHIFSSPPGF